MCWKKLYFQGNKKKAYIMYRAGYGQLIDHDLFYTQSCDTKKKIIKCSYKQEKRNSEA